MYTAVWDTVFIQLETESSVYRNGTKASSLIRCYLSRWIPGPAVGITETFACRSRALPEAMVVADDGKRRTISSRRMSPVSFQPRNHRNAAPILDRVCGSSKQGHESLALPKDDSIIKLRQIGAILSNSTTETGYGGLYSAHFIVGSEGDLKIHTEPIQNFLIYKQASDKSNANIRKSLVSE